MGFDSLLSVITDPTVFLLIFGGTLLGLIFGAIPGLTATLGCALLIPLTFPMSPLEAMSLLGGVYIGGISGGLVSATLINMPGTPSSICTTYDAFPMAKQGHATEALSIGVFSSFVGGIFSWIVLITIAPQLAKIALKFGPYEYFWLSVFGLIVIIGLSGKSPRKAFLGTILGILFSMVGMDPVGGDVRFTFGLDILRGGIDMVPVLMGFFVVSEILSSLEGIKEKYVFASEKVSKYSFKGIKDDLTQSIRNFSVSSLIGTFLGILPGVGGATANFITYDVAKKMSPHPEKFGTGYAQGIIASETGNNAVTGGALIPMLTLAIPGDSVTAVMLSAMMIHGLRPGPMLFTTSGDLVYAFFASILVANILMILIMFGGGIRFFIRALKIPKWALLPLVIVMIIAGTWTIEYSRMDLWVIFIFGFVGYLLKKLGYPMTPIVLGVILGPTMEDNLRRAAILSQGSALPFITRPYSVVIIVMIFVMVFATYMMKRAKIRS